MNGTSDAYEARDERNRDLRRRHTPLHREFGQRLRQCNKANMVVIDAAMRKLVHPAYGTLQTDKPFDERHAVSS